MAISENKKTFTRQNVQTVLETATVECALNLSEEYREKVLSLSASAFANSLEVSNGFVNYSGKVTFSAVVLAEETERVEVGAQFSLRTAIQDGQNVATVQYFLDEPKLKTDGGMLYAVVNLTAKLNLTLDEEITFVSDADVFCKTETFTAEERKKLSANYTVEDEFETLRVKKVLASDFSASVIKTETFDGKVVFDGEAVIALALLPFSENSDILKETRVIPFRFEAESIGTHDGDLAYAVATPRDLQVKITVDEESSKSTVEIVASLELSGQVITKSENVYLVDAFSAENELELKTQNVKFDKFIGTKSFNERFQGKSDCNVPEYSRFVKLVCERVELVNYKAENGELTVDMLVYGEGIFVGDNGLVSSRAELATSVELQYSADAVSDVTVTLGAVSGKLRSGKLELDGNVKIAFCEYEKVEIGLVTEIVEIAEKSVYKPAISVYLAKNGDEEWDVIKALGESIDDIAKTNPDLTFPLHGDEKIMVFRQK